MQHKIHDELVYRISDAAEQRVERVRTKLESLVKTFMTASIGGNPPPPPTPAGDKGSNTSCDKELPPPGGEDKSGPYPYLIACFGSATSVILVRRAFVYLFLFIYLFYLIVGFYISPSRANILERSAGSRDWYLGPLLGFSLRLRSPVCYRTPSLQPKYQTTGVNCTALYDHILLQPYSVQRTLHVATVQRIANTACLPV